MGEDRPNLLGSQAEVVIATMPSGSQTPSC